MGSESSPVPSLDELRSPARALGIEPADEDLEAAPAFLEAILPALREIEGRSRPRRGPLPSSRPREAA